MFLKIIQCLQLEHQTLKKDNCTLGEVNKTLSANQRQSSSNAQVPDELKAFDAELATFPTSMALLRRCSHPHIVFSNLLCQILHPSSYLGVAMQPRVQKNSALWQNYTRFSQITFISLYKLLIFNLWYVFSLILHDLLACWLLIYNTAAGTPSSRRPLKWDWQAAGDGRAYFWPRSILLWHQFYEARHDPWNP